MYEQVEKPKANKSRAVANSVVQKRNIGKKGFVDNRTNNITPKKLIQGEQKARNSEEGNCRDGG